MPRDDDISTRTPLHSPTKRLVILLAVVLAVVITLGFTLLDKKRESDIRNAEHAALLASRSVAASLSALLRQIDLTLLTVSDETIRHYEQGGIDERGLSAFIDRHFRRLPYLDSLRISDRNGVVLLGSGNAPTKRVSMADRDYYRYLVQHPDAGMILSLPIIGRISGKLVIACVRRINLKDDSFAGVVFGVIPLEILADTLRTSSGLTRSEILLSHEGGPLLLRIGNGTTHAVEGGEPLPRGSLIAGIASPDAGENQVVRGESPYDGVVRSYASSRVQGVNLRVVVGSSLSQLITDHRRNSLVFAAFTILLLLLAVAVVFVEHRYWHAAESARETVERAAREWQTTFDAMTESVAIMGVDRKIVRCNRATAEILGKSYQEIIGSDCCAVFHGEQGGFSGCPFDEVLERKETLSITFLSGDRYLEATMHPVQAPDGSIHSLIHLVRDVTDERRLTDRLRDVTELFELILRYTPVYTFVKRIEGNVSRVVAASDNFREMIGLSGSEMVGRTMEEIFPPEFAAKITADDMDVVRNNHKYEEEEVFGGIHYLTVKFPIIRSSGEHLIAGFTVDVSRLKKAEAELRSMQDQLIRQEKLAAVGQLAAGIAHEINNPVGFVRSNLVSLQKYVTRLLVYLETVEAGAAPWLPRHLAGIFRSKRRSANIDYIREDLPGLLNESLEGIERVRKIVSDLLSYARNDAETIRTVDLCECIEKSVTILWNEIKHRCTLDRQLSPLPPVACDPQRISQVFVNMISNALHALPEQGGKIIIRTFTDEGFAVVSISDNGTGIPPDLIPLIFDPFFTTKEAGKGTGLGLSISRKIVERYGGEIGVESEVGRGTTFFIRLPADQTNGGAGETIAGGVKIKILDMKGGEQ